MKIPVVISKLLRQAAPTTQFLLNRAAPKGPQHSAPGTAWFNGQLVDVKTSKPLQIDKGTGLPILSTGELYNPKTNETIDPKKKKIVTVPVSQPKVDAPVAPAPEKTPVEVRPGILQTPATPMDKTTPEKKLKNEESEAKDLEEWRKGLIKQYGKKDVQTPFEKMADKIFKRWDINVKISFSSEFDAMDVATEPDVYEKQDPNFEWKHYNASFEAQKDTKKGTLSMVYSFDAPLSKDGSISSSTSTLSLTAGGKEIQDPELKAAIDKFIHSEEKQEVSENTSTLTSHGVVPHHRFPVEYVNVFNNKVYRNRRHFLKYYKELMIPDKAHIERVKDLEQAEEKKRVMEQGPAGGITEKNRAAKDELSKWISRYKDKIKAETNSKVKQTLKDKLKEAQEALKSQDMSKINQVLDSIKVEKLKDISDIHLQEKFILNKNLLENLKTHLESIKLKEIDPKKRDSIKESLGIITEASTSPEGFKKNFEKIKEIQKLYSVKDLSAGDSTVGPGGSGEEIKTKEITIGEMARRLEKELPTLTKMVEDLKALLEEAKSDNRKKTLKEHIDVIEHSMKSPKLYWKNRTNNVFAEIKDYIKLVSESNTQVPFPDPGNEKALKMVEIFDKVRNQLLPKSKLKENQSAPPKAKDPHGWMSSDDIIVYGTLIKLFTEQRAGIELKALKRPPSMGWKEWGAEKQKAKDTIKNDTLSLVNESNLLIDDYVKDLKKRTEDYKEQSPEGFEKLQKVHPNLTWFDESKISTTVSKFKEKISKSIEDIEKSFKDLDRVKGTTTEPIGEQAYALLESYLENLQVGLGVIADRLQSATTSNPEDVSKAETQLAQLQAEFTETKGKFDAILKKVKEGEEDLDEKNKEALDDLQGKMNGLAIQIKRDLNLVKGLTLRSPYTSYYKMLGNQLAYFKNLYHIYSTQIYFFNRAHHKMYKQAFDLMEELMEIFAAEETTKEVSKDNLEATKKKILSLTKSLVGRDLSADKEIRAAANLLFKLIGGEKPIFLFQTKPTTQIPGQKPSVPTQTEHKSIFSFYDYKTIMAEMSEEEKKERVKTLVNLRHMLKEELHKTDNEQAKTEIAKNLGLINDSINDPAQLEKNWDTLKTLEAEKSEEKYEGKLEDYSVPASYIHEAEGILKKLREDKAEKIRATAAECESEFKKTLEILKDSFRDWGSKVKEKAKKQKTTVQKANDSLMKIQDQLAKETMDGFILKWRDIMLKHRSQEGDKRPSEKYSRMVEYVKTHLKEAFDQDIPQEVDKFTPGKATPEKIRKDIENIWGRVDDSLPKDEQERDYEMAVRDLYNEQFQAHGQGGGDSAGGRKQPKGVKPPPVSVTYQKMKGDVINGLKGDPDDLVLTVLSDYTHGVKEALKEHNIKVDDIVSQLVKSLKQLQNIITSIRAKPSIVDMFGVSGGPRKHKESPDIPVDSLKESMGLLNKVLEVYKIINHYIDPEKIALPSVNYMDPKSFQGKKEMLRKFLPEGLIDSVSYWQSTESDKVVRPGVEPTWLDVARKGEMSEKELAFIRENALHSTGTGQLTNTEINKLKGINFKFSPEAVRNWTTTHTKPTEKVPEWETMAREKKLTIEELNHLRSELSALLKDESIKSRRGPLTEKEIEQLKPIMKGVKSSLFVYDFPSQMSYNVMEKASNFAISKDEFEAYLS